mmetsp:Transcript_18416/g.42296  ORF Transcript_18416/g.42296 Transcript_18416/m.42296 type:complete len:121 (-) Transcript_18416:86-448(-)
MIDFEFDFDFGFEFGFGFEFELIGIDWNGSVLVLFGNVVGVGQSTISGRNYVYSWFRICEVGSFLFHGVWAYGTSSKFMDTTLFSSVRSATGTRTRVECWFVSKSFTRAMMILVILSSTS